MPDPTRPDDDTLRPVLPSARRWALHDAAASRAVEAAALATSAPHALMQRAGLAVARLAIAVAPHARRVWVACGPGNNGGDGLVAALHLARAGRQVRITRLGDPAHAPDDTRDALARAQAAGLVIEPALPATGPACDLAIDALLGLGAARAPDGELARAIALLREQRCPVLAVDLPSGLDGDRGLPLGIEAVRAAHTLSLLTLKPGLFTAQGRDAAGRVWLDTLGVDAAALAAPSAWLAGPQDAAAAHAARLHAQHKGSFGDVIAIGGAPGMGGALRLAARAALAAGAGRVTMAALDPAAQGQVDAAQPELMPRRLAEVMQPPMLAASTVVCGCGGGGEVREVLPTVLHHAARLVLDADALNMIAADAALATLLRARAGRGQHTVLTPHPLEAARLLGRDTAAVQADRLAAARALAAATGAIVLLKGSGTVVAPPNGVPAINPTGNARLGSAGTGDVLAGWLAGAWSQRGADEGFAVARGTAWLHGHAAEVGDTRLPLHASDLIGAMADRLPA